MKKSIIAIAIMAACASVSAQTKPIEPIDRVADILTVLTVGWIVSIGAVITGNVKPLCDRLGGVYDPYGADQCPSPPSAWRNLWAGK